jgi:cytidylate kinase
MAVCTVSRQYGAGGLSVAPAIAEALGFRFVDREITEEAARRLGLDAEVAEGRDERAPAIVEELGMALAAAAPPFGGGPAPHMYTSDDRTLADATRRIIVSMADAGGYVILGRGGQAALADRRDACHISLVGEIGDRARRIMASQSVDEREALALCEQVDSERAAYVRRFYRIDIRDPVLYDCVLNTSRLGVEGAIDIAVAVARRRLGLTEPTA